MIVDILLAVYLVVGFMFGIYGASYHVGRAVRHWYTNFVLFVLLFILYGSTWLLAFFLFGTLELAKSGYNAGKAKRRH